MQIPMQIGNQPVSAGEIRDTSNIILLDLREQVILSPLTSVTFTVWSSVLLFRSSEIKVDSGKLLMSGG